MMSSVRQLNALTGFLDAAHRLPPHRLPRLIADTARELGAEDARTWLADHQMHDLVDLDAAGGDERLPIDGTIAGRAFITSEPVVTDHDGGADHLWQPLLDGVDRIGVLEIVTHELTEVAREAYRHLASVAAAEIITRGQYTDLYTCIRRRRPMSLAAEMQWESLPPNSFSTTDVMVAAHLEPAYDIGGDCFDYAHDEGHLHLAIFDAVGHDLASTVVSSLALGSYRNSRRSDRGLGEMASDIDRTISHELGDGRFATGQLAILDTDNGLLHWLNAGHPLPLLMRQGRLVRSLECPPAPPFGLGHLRPGHPDIASEQLEPGDAVLFYSDGVIEARRARAEDYGLDRLQDLLHTAFASGLSPGETIRRLAKTVVEFHDGDPRDDATTVLVVWQPPR